MLLISTISLILVAVDSTKVHGAYCNGCREGNRSNRSPVLQNLLGMFPKPLRTLYSAHLLLQGRPGRTGGASSEISPSHVKSSAARKRPKEVYTTAATTVPATVSPDVIPYFTPDPSLGTALPRGSCASVSPGGDSEAISRNLQRMSMSDCGRLDSETLEGGDVVPGEFPWLALLVAETHYSPGKSMFVCGGSLISERYVLTVAHCVEDYRFKITSVVLGEYNTNMTEESCSSIESLFVSVVNGGGCHADPPLQVGVECTIAHPKYRRQDSLPNDIALVRLKHPVEFSGYVSPICLPIGRLKVNLEEEIDFGLRITVAGWGMKLNSSVSSTPMKAEIPLMDYLSCQNLVPHIPSGKLCVGDVIGQTPCAGDSGGPLLTRKMLVEDAGEELGRKKVPRAVQVGIVSLGPRDCESLRPTLCTNVQDYLLWILENMQP